MTMLRAILTLAAALVNVGEAPSPPSLDAPPSIHDSLSAIFDAINGAGECIDPLRDSKLEAQYDRLEGRYFAALADAKAIWGPGVDPIADGPGHESSASCKRIEVASALKRADQALLSHSKLFQAATSHMNKSGVWLGPLKLCRENVERAALVTDTADQPALEVELRSSAAPILRQITERSVGHPLAIRFHGDVIASPNVAEPITGGTVWIVGAEGHVLQQARNALTSSC